MSHADRAIADPQHTIVALTVPDDVDAPDADDFVGMAAVKATVEAEQRGAAGPPPAPPASIAAEMLPSWKDESAPMRGFVAKVGDHVVARASLALPVDAEECWAAVSVLPGFRGRGIGGELHARLEHVAREAGRTTMQNQTSFPAGTGGDAVQAATGFGSVPRSLASTRFLERHGYALGQVGRLSSIRLPLDAGALASRLADAASQASGYRTVTWQGRTPEAWLEGVAHLRTRMSIDTPNAGIAQTVDVWTAERVRSLDDLWEQSPRTIVTSIAVDDATGRVVGFTELDVPQEADRPVEQMDTLVSAEHRGRRLGMLLKLTNLREVAARFPRHASVETMNAEDNRPMLDVNEAIGFAPVSLAARWRRTLA